MKGHITLIYSTQENILAGMKNIILNTVCHGIKNVVDFDEEEAGEVCEEDLRLPDFLDTSLCSLRGSL